MLNTGIRSRFPLARLINWIARLDDSHHTVSVSSIAERTVTGSLRGSLFARRKMECGIFFFVRRPSAQLRRAPFCVERVPQQYPQRVRYAGDARLRAAPVFQPAVLAGRKSRLD
jgi:hypothetical protein